MNWNDEQTLTGQKDTLLAGFTPEETVRLLKLRRKFAPFDETQATYRRLEFVRWLVRNGRLTDQKI